MAAACPAARAAAAAGARSSAAGIPPAKRRRIPSATSSSPRAKARVRAIRSRGRPSPGAAASKIGSTRSAQSAANSATARLSASLSVCGERTGKSFQPRPAVMGARLTAASRRVRTMRGVTRAPDHVGHSQHTRSPGGCSLVDPPAGRPTDTHHEPSIAGWRFVRRLGGQRRNRGGRLGGGKLASASRGTRTSLATSMLLSALGHTASSRLRPLPQARSRRRGEPQVRVQRREPTTAGYCGCRLAGPAHGPTPDRTAGALTAGG